MNQAEALYHLQEIELQIIRRQKRLNEIDAILADDQAVAAAQAQLKTAQLALPPLKTHVRDLELEMAGTQQKANATEEQLYSGKVKNTKEMQDMQQEVATLRKRHGEMEEKLLDAMMTTDDAETTIRDAEQALNAVLDTRKDSHRSLIDERADLRNQITRWQAERAEAIKPIQPANLELYRALRPKKHNQPMAIMRGDGCSVCGVEQTMAIVRQAQLGQSLATCLSCGRILVYRGISDD